MFEPDPEAEYRKCPECGADCSPEPFETDRRMRISSCARSTAYISSLIRSRAVRSIACGTPEATSAAVVEHHPDGMPSWARMRRVVRRHVS